MTCEAFGLSESWDGRSSSFSPRFHCVKHIHSPFFFFSPNAPPACFLRVPWHVSAWLACVACVRCQENDALGERIARREQALSELRATSAEGLRKIAGGCVRLRWHGARRRRFSAGAACTVVPEQNLFRNVAHTSPHLIVFPWCDRWAPLHSPLLFLSLARAASLTPAPTPCRPPPTSTTHPARRARASLRRRRRSRRSRRSWQRRVTGPPPALRAWTLFFRPPPPLAAKLPPGVRRPRRRRRRRRRLLRRLVPPLPSPVLRRGLPRPPPPPPRPAASSAARWSTRRCPPSSPRSPRPSALPPRRREQGAVAEERRKKAADSPQLHSHPVPRCRLR